MSGAPIKLWRIPLDGTRGPIAAQTPLLDASELRALHRITDPVRALAFATRRAARRRIVAETLGIDAGHVAFTETAAGEPMIDGLALSTSHIEALAVVGVSSEGPIGIDIEDERPINYACLAERVLNSAELMRLARLAPLAQTADFRCCWTAKEAVLKAMGRGLDLTDLAKIETPPRCSYAWSDLTLHGSIGMQGSWRVIWPSVAPNATVALVAREDREIVSLRSMNAIGE